MKLNTKYGFHELFLNYFLAMNSIFIFAAKLVIRYTSGIELIPESTQRQFNAEITFKRHRRCIALLHIPVVLYAC